LVFDSWRIIIVERYDTNYEDVKGAFNTWRTAGLVYRRDKLSVCLIGQNTASAN